MRSHARRSLLALLTGVLIVIALPAAASAAPGILRFESLTCKENEEIGKSTCSAATPEKFFKQAGGHPPFGITDFTLNPGEFVIAGNGVKSTRTDLPVGFSTNPEALSHCSQSDFEANLGKSEESHCPASSQSGVQEAVILLPGPTEFPLKGKVYNLVPRYGLPLEFGIDIPLPFLGGIHVHTLLEGFVSWHKEKEAEEEGIESGDYHEFFITRTARSLAEGEAPLLRSRLVTFGNLGSGLLTNPTTCPGPQLTHLRVETFSGAVATRAFESTVTGPEERCDLLAPFAPAFTTTNSPETRDEGTELAADLKFSLDKKANETEPSDLKKTVVTLPEGFTINPAAASGIQACTPAQLNVPTEEVACPARSEIGNAVLSVPGLPPESLSGKVYLGADSLPIGGPPYKIYIAVASKRYGQAVRLEGSVVPNLETGQITTTFDNNPQGPFNDLKVSFNGGVFADLANPLECGASHVHASFTPWSAPGEFTTLEPELRVAGGNCPTPAGFGLAQSSTVEPAKAGGSSTFTFSLERPDGQQYLRTVKTVLPPGLVGLIPTAVQCGEPQASKGECPSSSQIGTASVTAGAGPEPFAFNGRVYLTGPYAGAPFGLTIVTPVVAGPFNFGNEITRAKIEVDKTTAQVTASTTLPTIKQGIPIKLRTLTVTINRQGFERSPTYCGPLRTASTVSSTSGAVAEVASGFQVEGCDALPFAPTFAATTGAKTSKNNGASLSTTIKQTEGQANIRSVMVTLPKQLPSRLTTLQKACLQATFEANPASCPEASNVGIATAVTPALPGQMTGPAYLVSHGGAAFPDLDLVLQGSGVTVILVGNTDIKNGITTTTFASTPDVPVSSVTVNLPTGPHSALAGFGDLCRSPLYMPAVITAWSGKQVTLKPKISVTGCGVKIISRRVVHSKVLLTIQTFEAGRVSVSGSGFSSQRRSLRGASRALHIKLSLSSRGKRRHRPFRTRIRVSFVPSHKGPHSSASTVIRFR